MMGILKARSRKKRRRRNMSGLEGKVALVTGGSRGSGAAIARRLARGGADVALTYLSAVGRAESVVEEIEAAGRVGPAIPADGADPKAVLGAVERTVDEFGRLDVLVNNAGVFPNGPLEDVNLEESCPSMWSRRPWTRWGGGKWDDATLMEGNVAEQVSELKRKPGGDILVAGSISLVRHLMREDLVDEIHLQVYPVVFGSGRRLFEEGSEPKRFELVAAKTLGTGVLDLTYRRRRSA